MERGTGRMIQGTQSNVPPLHLLKVIELGSRLTKNSAKVKLPSHITQRSLQIWEHSTWLCAATLRHHRESVWDVRVHGGKVVTCGVDGNVAVVSLNREEEFPVLMMVTETRSESVDRK